MVSAYKDSEYFGEITNYSPHLCGESGPFLPQIGHRSHYAKKRH